MHFTAIVAYGIRNRVMGNHGQLPWPMIVEDLKIFKKMTVNQIVVMGRATFESIPPKSRPLPNRINLVLSKQGINSIDHSQILTCASIESCINVCMNFPAKTPYVIGGQKVYQEFLARNLIRRVIASEVYGDWPGDRFFPILSGGWKRRNIKSYEQFDLVEYIKRDQNA